MIAELTDTSLTANFPSEISNNFFKQPNLRDDFISDDDKLGTLVENFTIKHKRRIEIPPFVKHKDSSINISLELFAKVSNIYN